MQSLWVPTYTNKPLFIVYRFFILGSGDQLDGACGEINVAKEHPERDRTMLDF